MQSSKSSPLTNQHKSSLPTNQHQVFFRPDAFPVAQPTVSEHWGKSNKNILNINKLITLLNNLHVNSLDNRESDAKHNSNHGLANCNYCILINRLNSILHHHIKHWDKHSMSNDLSAVTVDKLAVQLQHSINDSFPSYTPHIIAMSFHLILHTS